MVDTKLLTEHVLLHVNAKGGVFDAVSREEFSKVFMIEFDPLRRLTEGKAVILDGVLVMNGGELVDFEFDTGT